MKVLVCAKRVVDSNVKVRVKADQSNVDIEHSKMSLNPFDENAIEAAVRLKEQGIVSEIVVVAIGGAKCEETLRNALARGCDRALLLETSSSYEPINIAKILAAIYHSEQPQLVLLGKQAIDDDANQVAQMLAGMLDLPQATFASELSFVAERLMVCREVDGGRQTLALCLPAVVSADLSLNEPRFIKLPQLMQAKKKSIQKILVSSLALDLTPRTRLISVSDGEVRKQCKFINSSAELVSLIQQLKG